LFTLPDGPLPPLGRRRKLKETHETKDPIIQVRGWEDETDGNVEVGVEVGFLGENGEKFFVDFTNQVSMENAVASMQFAEDLLKTYAEHGYEAGNLLMSMPSPDEPEWFIPDDGKEPF
jgi:hypothetical protein